MEKKRRKYTEEFRKDVVSMIEKEGYSLQEASQRFDVHASILAKWKRRFSSTYSPMNHSSRLLETSEKLKQEVQKLQKENKRLLQEREILKKAMAFFVSENK